MKFDTHPDLLIQPYRNGVKLVKPNDQSSSLMSIGNIFSMPLITYIVNSDTFFDANHLTRITNIPKNMGYYSDNDLKNTPFSHLFSKQALKMFDIHNGQVLNNNRLMIYDEVCHRLDDINFSTITFKFPVYNEDNDPIAIFGISALMDNTLYTEAEPLSKALDRIINTGLIKITYSHKQALIPGMSIDNIYLSKQEIHCLRLLITGKTYKLIGSSLQLSERTVEHYIENIKYKLNVKTKVELIEKVFQQIWPDMLQTHLLD